MFWNETGNFSILAYPLQVEEEFSPGNLSFYLL
jgi:hypothetical protein